AVVRRVPEVEVLELRPHPEVGVRQIEQARVRSQPQPRIVDAELNPPRVLPDEKFLPGRTAQRRLATLLLESEPVLCFGDEARGFGFELVPDLWIGHELREGPRRIAVLAQPIDDLLLGLIERRRLVRVPAPA